MEDYCHCLGLRCIEDSKGLLFIELFSPFIYFLFIYFTLIICFFLYL